MAHFAEINEDNIVLRVIVISNNECKDDAGNESEAVGAEFCRNLLGGTWKQTSYMATCVLVMLGLATYTDQTLMLLLPQSLTHHGLLMKKLPNGKPQLLVPKKVFILGMRILKPGIHLKCLSKT